MSTLAEEVDALKYIKSFHESKAPQGSKMVRVYTWEPAYDGNYEPYLPAGNMVAFDKKGVRYHTRSSERIYTTVIPAEYIRAKEESVYWGETIPGPIDKFYVDEISRDEIPPDVTIGELRKLTFR